MLYEHAGNGNVPLRRGIKGEVLFPIHFNPLLNFFFYPINIGKDIIIFKPYNRKSCFL